MEIWLGKHPVEPWRGAWALDWHTVDHEGPGYRRSELGELVYALKYGTDRSAAATIAERLAEFVSTLYVFRNVAAIIPVPPSDRERVWQPVEVLADELAARTGRTADREWLVRVRAGAPLKDLESPEEREGALRGAFAVTDPDRYHGRPLLLLDDIFRSGATLRECTRAMLRDGACAAVYAVTITRTRVRR
ncbi:hypothetical protein [Tepidiforma sp.]|uniref:ComF family protein n=1 Tax=Tepidiforma sp. TaxID=2682230 RepID=UPI00261ECBEA|nr:hypothetical protein [Tepidiforma sp.]MCX7618956.1 hypothetical protein [Tepidiforma sp.]